MEDNMNKALYKAFSLVIILALMFMAVPVKQAQAVGGITQLGFPYTQNFDSLANTGTPPWINDSTLSGWFLSTDSNSSVTSYLVGTGSGTTGGFYSFGASSNTERALGGLGSNAYYGASGVGKGYIGWILQNQTGATITTLTVSYTGEQWRNGGNTAVQSLTFAYATSASPLNLTDPGTAVPALDFASPIHTSTATALDGNAAANRTAVSSTITGLNIPNNYYILLRWTDLNDSGNDHALAVDNLSITATGIVADPAPMVSSTTPTGGATDVLLTYNITVNFSEPVNVSGNWFQLVCPTSGTRYVADTIVTGGPSTFTIDPIVDFANSETCDMTIFAAQVADQDSNDPPDTMAADYNFGFTGIGPDNAPAVASTMPADGATNVPLNQNITITFTEPVNATDPWFSLTCATSGAHPAAVTGGPTSFTLNPTADFVYGEQCTLVIDATKVSDVDNNDPPDNMIFNFTAGFTTQPDPCTLPYTPIYQIQGSGLTVALPGSRTSQGVVVGDYEGPSPALRGFFIQDPAGDGNPATSDGIFVFEGSNANTVSIGDIVRVTGNAGENQGQSQISVGTIVKCGTGTVTPTDVAFPVAAVDYLEQYEGMLVRLPQTMYVTEHFQLGRFGQVVLSSGARLQQPTNVVAPGTPANALQAQNNLNKIILDDASQTQNPDPILFARGGQPLSASNTLRGGDTATNIVGVLNYTWAGNSASGNAYRIRPINALNGYINFQPANPRPTSAPNVGGTVKVVGMNLLNFFNTFADGNTSTPGCFPSGADSDCRGASNANEFDRQYTKTVTAILAMSPDVLGVNEIENDGYGPTSAIQFLVDQLNAKTAPGTYAFINVDANTGQVNAMGLDAIKVAMLYKPGVVTPVGQTAPLNSTAFVNGGDSVPRNRVSLAQAFQVNTTGAVFIVDANHLKSKGSACDAPDAGDGQGNCNQVRVNAVTGLLNWFATDPTGTGDPDILMIGDYNSYAMEDPITTIKNAGFTNLIESFLGPDAYSYVFDGQWGYLDHALGSTSIISQITGVGDYHINADEPSVLDYLEDFKSAGQLVSLYAPDEFRVSDHDPVVVGLDLVNYPPELGDITVSSSLVPVGTSVNASVPFTDPDKLDTHTATWDWGDGNTSAGAVTESNGSGTIDGSHVYATPGIYTVTVTVNDGYGNSDTATYKFVVVYDPNGGFVTGGGWIASPAGAYVADPLLAGKASFGFVAKYKKGQTAPDGNTQFQFHAAGFNFSSTSYEWLVVAGSKAQYKGVGTINGQGVFNFMLTADDNNPDTFRLKIWDTAGIVIYDNGSQQALGGGSITVHK
jgi:predicted extracellular nuclease